MSHFLGRVLEAAVFSITYYHPCQKVDKEATKNLSENVIKYCGFVVNTSNPYVVGPRFTYCPIDQLSCLKFFMVFHSHPEQMPE